MTRHRWTEVRDDHIPVGVGPDGLPASWEERRFWRCVVCGGEDSTLVWREYHSIAGSAIDETQPPDAAGCDPDMSAVYEVLHS